MAFYGTKRVTIDAKGRFAVPTQHRAEILAAEGIADDEKVSKVPLMITRGPKRELWLLPMGNWKRLCEGIGQLPTGNAFRRRIETNAEMVEMDANGRLLVPAGLREKGLLPNPSLAFMGAGKHFEIWDWEESRRDEDDRQPEAEETARDFNY